MSSTFDKDEPLRELLFRNVNGSKLKLLDKSAKARNVTKFVLYKNIRVNVNGILLFTVTTLFLWKSFNILIPFVVSVLILILKLVCFVTAVNKDTLTVVESVGIYTEGRRIFYGSSCSEFIPWDTVVDIFINEVITGVAKGIILSYYHSEGITWREKRFDKISSFISRLNTRAKMPGIYVRKASWIDWTEKEENPALVVPGSYWLCHKNNMYKFIFRYHRITRNVKKFNYGKELMKVIRRIIKSQPPQGQQFGTSHLLVTFGRTAWTRPDKMFAIMQFKERSVRAYSHAFVLTIKISHPFQQDGNLYAGHDNDNKNDKRNCKRCSIRSTKDDFSEESNQCDNIQGQTLESKNISIELDNDIVDNNLENSVNKESVEQLNNNESRNEFNKNTDASFELPIVSENIQLHNESTERNYDCLETSSVIRNELSSEKLDEHKIGKNSVEYKDTCLSSNSKILSDCRTCDDTNVDSVNLPYQYLIEKEIENAKQNSENYDLNEINRGDYTKHTETESGSTKTEDSPCSKKKKYALDNVARSSDITDLVMEGLMFTIRQGQDAVTVIEQKTKLEIDEVLENSEEIETEEGERRLRNSSLLGLENLITMIELPKQNEHENKGRNVMVKNSEPLLNDIKHSLPSNESRERIIAGTSFSNIDRDTGVTNNVNYSKIKAFKYDEGDEDVEEEAEDDVEEDIIPEALQNEIFQPSTLSHKIDDYNKSLKDMRNKDLLMDGIEHDEFMKSKMTRNPLNLSFNETLQPRFYTQYDCLNNNLDTKSGEMSSNSVLNETHNDTVYQPNFNDSKKGKSNVPVVISNQAITLNQIPLPLQKILKTKLSVKHATSYNKDNKGKNNADICNVSSKEEGEIIKEQLKSQIDGNALKNAQCLNHYQESIDDKKETYYETTLFEESKEELEDTNSSEKSIKLKNEKSLERNNCTENVEKIPMGEIKDITEQFYQDFSYLQTKRNSINEKYLRSRGKPSNLLNDGKDGEMQVQMMKFFHDITRGAKVVVRRISINKYS